MQRLGTTYLERKGVFRNILNMNDQASCEK